MAGLLPEFEKGALSSKNGVSLKFSYGRNTGQHQCLIATFSGIATKFRTVSRACCSTWYHSRHRGKGEAKGLGERSRIFSSYT